MGRRTTRRICEPRSPSLSILWVIWTTIPRAFVSERESAFSTYAVEAQGMARADAWGTAAAYVALSVVLGLLAVRSGYWLGRLLATARRT